MDSTLEPIVSANIDFEPLIIEGTPDDDVLEGGAGNDILEGGAGNDTIEGGAGNDTIAIDSFPEVSENQALLEGLVVFDLSDTPALVSNTPFEIAGISDIAVQDNVFASSNPDIEELVIGEVSDAGDATLGQIINIPGGVSEVVFAPNGLVVIAGDIGGDIETQSSTLTLIDPDTGNIIGSNDFTTDVDGPFDPFGVAVSADSSFVFISGGFSTNEVAVFTIEDPANPTFVTAVETAGSQAFGIALVNETLFVSSPEIITSPDGTFAGFVTVVDVSDPAAPAVDEVVSLAPLGAPVDTSAAELDNGETLAISVSGDFSATGGPVGGLSVLAGAEAVGSFELPFNTGSNVVTTGDFAFVSSADSLFIIDVSEPDAPALVSQTPLADGFSVTDVAIDDNLAFLTVDAIEDGEGVEGGTAFGGDGNDIIVGSDRDDVLSGDAGDDVIVGGPGADIIDGGSDDDIIASVGGTDTISGGDGDDIINGGNGDDVIDGGDGDDNIEGGIGDDIVDGGDGDDIIESGLGNDTIDGGNGDDMIESGSGDDIVDGGDGNDIIASGVGLDAPDGDDVLAGGLGNDIIFGDSGDDVLRGDLNDRDSQDDIDGGNDIIFGGNGDDRIGGKSGNDILSGDAGDDYIFGDDGDDILMGVTGNDILVGDNFSGGSGSDLFVFGNDDGTDTILDFQVGIDRIGLVEGELLFADLTITQDGSDAIITVVGTGENLAILENVQASALGAESFESIPDVSNLDEALSLGFV